MDVKRAIRVARGIEPADLCVRNCRVVNVLSGEIHESDVAVDQGFFVGFGPYASRQSLDARGRYLCPGLIEGHIHIESSLLSPPEFARTVARFGTAAVVCDPHEIANVWGRRGIEYMLEATRTLPVEIYLTLPSCVPATHLETSGARLDADDIAMLLQQHPERLLGLGEMMNYPGVLAGDEQVLAKLAAAGSRIVDGHAPGLSGRDLNAYVIAGAGSDHECTEAEEGREKLRAGMHLMVRESSMARNMATLVPVITPEGSRNVSLVTDDRLPEELLRLGHLDYAVRRAISLGVAPLRAVQMASINTARYFGLRRRGAVAPGYRADFLLVNDLEMFSVQETYLEGRAVSEWEFSPQGRYGIGSPFEVPELSFEHLRIPASGHRVRAIEIVPGQILTREWIGEPAVREGESLADPRRDLCKLAVVERYQGSGRTGLGFVRGLGIAQGAVGSSIAHDSHNVILAGTNDRDMLRCLSRLRETGGGLVLVSGGKILAELVLPIAGLMSDARAEAVAERFATLVRSQRCIGSSAGDLFQALSFLALPVIPKLRLTDRGLVDVDRFEFVPLFAD